VTRGWLGVEPRQLDAELARHFGLSQTAGVVIAGVLQNGPAAAAGIRPGDVITHVQGEAVTDVSGLLRAVAALTPGEAASIQLRRRDTALTVSVVPGRRQPSQQPNGASR
jgi:S1-C subfamily serine protease